MGCLFWFQSLALFYLGNSIIMPGIMLCMRPANERQRYNVTSSLIGWRMHRMTPAMLNILLYLTVLKWHPTEYHNIIWYMVWYLIHVSYKMTSYITLHYIIHAQNNILSYFFQVTFPNHIIGFNTTKWNWAWNSSLIKSNSLKLSEFSLTPNIKSASGM